MAAIPVNSPLPERDHLSAIPTAAPSPLKSAQSMFMHVVYSPSMPHHTCNLLLPSLRLGLTDFSGCNTATWTGGNCDNSDETIPNSGCYDGAFSSVSVSCPA